MTRRRPRSARAYAIEAGQTIGALGSRCRPYAGSEVAQLAIDPVALDHVDDTQAGFLVKGYVVDAEGLRLGEIRLAKPPPPDLDMVGVRGSIPLAPNISRPPAPFSRRFSATGAMALGPFATPTH